MEKLDRPYRGPDALDIDKPYRGPNAIFPQCYRDSRQAFGGGGSRFEVTKPSRDYLWTIGALILSVGFVVMLFGGIA